MIFSIFLFVLSFLILLLMMTIHELGHFIVAKKFGIQVEEFGIGYPPRLFGKKIGETTYSINLLPLGALVKIRGEEGGIEDYRSFSSLKIWKRVLIVLGGVLAFWICAIVIFSILFMIGAEIPIGDQDVPLEIRKTNLRITMVARESPAFEVGLKKGDIILELKSGAESIKANKIKDFQEFVKKYAGQEIELTIERKGEILKEILIPRENPPPGQGSIGVALDRTAMIIEKSPWYLAPFKGTIYTGFLTVKALQGFYFFFENIFSGKGMPEGAEFAGPLGITVFLANAATYGLGFFLYFIGIIAVLVSIFNLFPIPALDGGKLVFLLIEKIRGKPVSYKLEQGITLFSFLILIIFSLFITINFDIPRFIEFFRSS